MNVIIIGASQGIGKALAIEYASAGANLVLLSRNIEAIKRISEQINSSGGKSFYKECDVNIKLQVKDAISFGLEKLGTIDLAILNAGVGLVERMEKFSSDEFIKSFDTNVFGIAYAMEYLIPIMKQQGYGTIAGVTSLADGRGYPGSPGYNSSKAAASTFLESSRISLKKFNIDVLTVKPGFVRTAMTAKNRFKMPFLMSSEKAAVLIRKGIGKKKSIVQFPFFTVNLTRLAKIAPNWLFDPVIRKLKREK